MAFSFDFKGAYDEVREDRLITYMLDSGRTARLTFSGNYPVTLTESFEPDEEPAVQEQEHFCRAILQSFKSHVEQRARYRTGNGAGALEG